MKTNSPWPPLESCPEIFDKYFRGVTEDNSITFNELISLDYKEFLTVEQGPVLGVMLSYERGQNPTVRKESNIMPPSYVPFYMKQNEALDNACGLIAGIHIIGNNLSYGKVQAPVTSILGKFFQTTTPVNWIERANILETFHELKTFHQDLAGEGQSEITDDTRHHYVAFIHYNDSIIELDGLQTGPYLVKEGVSAELFLDETVEEIRRRVNEGEITESLNIMFVGNGETKINNLLDS
jgi:hypothetical protein